MMPITPDQLLTHIKVHTKYLKIILGVHNNVCNIAVYGETDRYPFFITQNVKVFKYWLKIIQMSENSLVRMKYSRLLSLNNCGFITWTSKCGKWLPESKILPKSEICYCIYCILGARIQ
jgi:hypothetical protein